MSKVFEPYIIKILNWLNRFLHFISIRQHIKDYIRSQISIQVLGDMKDVLFTLEDDKHYILILPSDLPTEIMQREFSPFVDNLNMIVIQADNASLIELSNNRRP